MIKCSKDKNKKKKKNAVAPKSQIAVDVESQIESTPIPTLTFVQSSPTLSPATQTRAFIEELESASPTAEVDLESQIESTLIPTLTFTQSSPTLNLATQETTLMKEFQLASATEEVSVESQIESMPTTTITFVDPSPASSSATQEKPFMEELGSASATAEVDLESQIESTLIPTFTFVDHSPSSSSATQERALMEELQSASATADVGVESQTKSTTIPTLTFVDPLPARSSDTEETSSEKDFHLTSTITAVDKVIQALQPQDMADPNSTSVVHINEVQVLFIKRPPLDLVKVDVSQMPIPNPSDITQISPAAQLITVTTSPPQVSCTAPKMLNLTQRPPMGEVEADVSKMTNPAPPKRKENRVQNMIKVALSLAGALFLATFVFLITDAKSYILQTILSKLLRFMTECMPMYCVLMIDQCYSIALRRTKTWLANNFKVYFD